MHWSAEPDGSNWRATVRVKTDDGWNLKVVLSEQKGGVVVRELQLTPSNTRKIPAGGITQRRLEDITLSDLRRGASAVAHEFFGDEAKAAAAMQALLTGAPTATGGRKRMTDREKAEISVRYAQLARRVKACWLWRRNAT